MVQLLMHRLQKVILMEKMDTVFASTIVKWVKIRAKQEKSSYKEITAVDSDFFDLHA